MTSHSSDVILDRLRRSLKTYVLRDSNISLWDSNICENKFRQWKAFPRNWPRGGRGDFDRHVNIY